MSVNTIYTNLTKDIDTYLTDKLPELPVSTAMEIGAYISHKVLIAICDLWVEQVRLDRLEMNRSMRKNRTDWE